MKSLFTSATLRLTGWYIIVLACISLFFSVIVYQISVGEVERRLINYQDKSWSLLQPSPGLRPFDRVRSLELDESKASVVGVLMYLNLAVLAVGGCASYLLAKRTLRPIEEAHEQQTRFVSDASHELRTPLTAMTTELEVILNDPASNKKELRSTLSSTLEEVQRLTKLSSMLLALSSNDAQPIEQQTIDISSIGRRIAARYNKIEKRITLKVPRGRCLAYGNQASVEELCAIFIDNALRYSPKHSQVNLSVTHQSGRVMICVENQGEGIAPEHRDYIFDRFYRGDTARSNTEGYGLGLALAQQIAAMLRTTIEVESTPGASTIFSFSLAACKKNTK